MGISRFRLNSQKCPPDDCGNPDDKVQVGSEVVQECSSARTTGGERSER
jgi:hypothetical protein